MSQSCAKHQHERGVDVCRRCGELWCGTCLIYALGPKKPPYCMSCAMVAGGVRTSAMLPAVPRKELRARRKAHRGEELASRGVEAVPDPGATDPIGEAPVDSDWAAPWWEDRESSMAD